MSYATIKPPSFSCLPSIEKKKKRVSEKATLYKHRTLNRAEGEEEEEEEEKTKLERRRRRRKTKE